MKKCLFIISGFILSFQTLDACAWYDPDYEYFNLFTQSIIQDKSFTPFLLTYSNPYYEDKNVILPDDNIEEWQNYFNDELSLQETKDLVYKVSMDELNHLKFKKNVQNPLIKKLGYKFYTKYKEALDYLIQAKYLEPYMRIKHINNPDSFYYGINKDTKYASDLNFSKVASDLVSLYKATDSKPIKLRYGYQLVRFLHYNRNYMGAIDAFTKYIEPLKLKSVVYYLALDQMAGAQRAIGLYKDANWNFFQVFMHTQSRKASAFSSMRLTNKSGFQDILNRAQTKDEKVMAYFLLGYQDFNNPIGIMKKIYQIDPNSEALQVLEARAINELERTILVTSYPFSTGDEDEKISGDHPYRIPMIDDKIIYIEKENNYLEKKAKDYLLEIETFTQKLSQLHQDAFWDISLAYLKFLQSKYEESEEILNAIQTDNKEYIAEIKQMKMLNDIVAQPVIDRAYEEKLMRDYASFFIEQDQQETGWEDYKEPSTKEFSQDVIANRYYLQKAYAKSFLMSNKLTDLAYDPDIDLTQSLEKFYHKRHKSTFEKQILAKKFNVEDPDSYFNFIYGDYYARNGNFLKALKNYKKVKNGEGFIPTSIREWDADKKDYVVKDYPKDRYDLFNHISPYIFGHNIMVSYNSPDTVTMVKEAFANEFDFVHQPMNKIELMEHLLSLQKIGQTKGENAAKANQLIANVLYNTSKLGYYRHLFILDHNNGNGTKFHFYPQQGKDKYYSYKYYYSRSGSMDNGFDQPKNYYLKALSLSNNKEQQAQILFQLAKIEQGEYYQWEADQPEIPYTEDDWYEKQQQQEKDFLKVKRENFRTNFEKLKENYANTENFQEFKHRCSYLEQFLKS